MGVCEIEVEVFSSAVDCGRKREEGGIVAMGGGVDFGSMVVVGWAWRAGGLGWAD